MNIDDRLRKRAFLHVYKINMHVSFNAERRNVQRSQKRALQNE